MAAKIDMRMVYAVEGRRVRDPAHPKQSAIPAEGRFVAWGPYWKRRLQDGDIALDAPPAAPDPVAPNPVAPDPVAPDPGAEAAPAKPAKPVPAPGVGASQPAPPAPPAAAPVAADAPNASVKA
jgi:hypothetical protein